MDRPTILIADDQPEITQLLKMFVRPLECETLEAFDGEQALELANAHLPDVILLDVQMPKKSGWEVCQALKAVQRTSGIPVILMTGRGEVKDRLTGLQVGADDYLVKPFKRDEVVRRVGAQLERQQARRERAHSLEEERDSLEALIRDRATGLPTIPLVLEKVKELLIEQGELGIVFVDVEQFENIEGEYGWAFFDEFLRKVGEVICQTVEAAGGRSLVAADRVGGSNFFVFLGRSGRGPKPAASVAADLRERVTAELRQRFPSMQSVAFFISEADLTYQPALRLERQIYAGMQRAADIARDAEMRRKLELARELRDIIQEKRVKTLFQPIVWAQQASLFGYEILTRGPQASSFPNSDMLFAFARENNLAWQLEAIALERSLEKLRGTDLGDRKFLINFEAETFSESDLHLHDIIQYFDQNRGRFVFELTERAAIEDYAAFREVLSEFRNKGIEIAIDDAGSGYASLEAIASLSPDYLKITKGLISTLGEEPIKQDLVRMLVDLGHRIGAKTIAEGIETHDEWSMCRDLGIDLMQGYFLAHPQEEFATAHQELAVSLGQIRSAAN